jgi:multidrug resistance efflux pump
MSKAKIKNVVAAIAVGGSTILVAATPAGAEESAPQCAKNVGTDGVAHPLGHPEIDIPKCTGRLVKLDRPVSAADRREAVRKARAAKREAARKARAAKREAARKARAAEREATRKQRAAEREAARKARAAKREAARKARAVEREARHNLSLGMDENGRYWS